jgi:Xaa-Pro aminopeptidase
MAPPFARSEYQGRLRQVRASMQAHGLDALFITDPANINWLSGYDAWSFYVPQAMLVEGEGDPTWIGRDMDAGAAAFTTYLTGDRVVAVPERYVQRTDAHPGDYMGDVLASRGLDGKRIGYESDGYYLSPRWLAAVQAKLPNAQFIDADLVVNWCRVVKSQAEIACMKTASLIAGQAMRAAFEGLAPGVRQCDLMGQVTHAQIRGLPDAAGHLTAIYPLVLAGEKGTTAHPMWDDSRFEDGQTIAFELGGCRNRYNAGLARTAHLGAPPANVSDTAKAVEEGMEAVLSTLKAGVEAQQVHAAWQRVLDRYGLEKKSRIGYSIGVGYAPDWGERTLSFRPGATSPVPENAVVHVILGMWMDGWGLELSETIHVRAEDCVCLTEFSRDLHVIA